MQIDGKQILDADLLIDVAGEGQVAFVGEGVIALEAEHREHVGQILNAGVETEGADQLRVGQTQALGDVPGTRHTAAGALRLAGGRFVQPLQQLLTGRDKKFVELTHRSAGCSLWFRIANEDGNSVRFGVRIDGRLHFLIGVT